MVTSTQGGTFGAATARTRTRATLLLVKAVASTAVTLSSGCASLLGIEPAQCDPTFDEQRCTGQGTKDSSAPLGSDSPGPDSPGPGPTVAEAGAAEQEAGAEPTAPDSGVPAARAAVCDQYCVAVQQACVEANSQYQSEVSCLEICTEVMRTEAERNAEGIAGNDTIECRLGAALSVIEVGTEVESLCLSAGMWGNDECGAPCDVYCGMMQVACGTQFESFSHCPDECAEVEPGTQPFGVDVPPGNTLECRINHIRLATSTRNPTQHCPHAAGLGAPCAGPAAQ